MKNPKILIVIVALALAFVAFLVIRGGGTNDGGGNTENFGSQSQTTSVIFRIGQKTEDVSFIDFSGNTHRLSDFEGTPVVLDFWAAWCPYCVTEMPELQAAQDKYPSELVMIGVHRTDTESQATGEAFAKDLGVNYLLVIDTDGSLYQAAGGVSMPLAVFIDSNGIVRDIKSGPKTKSEIEEKIGALMQGGGE